jgi:hypothetical protein
VNAEVLFVAGYAAVLLAVAAALHRLGRFNTDPWRSRALAAYRSEVPELPPRAAPSDWPHREVGRLHTAIGAVAAAAALLLCVGEVPRHHAVAEVLVLLAVAVPSALVGAALLRRVR